MFYSRCILLLYKMRQRRLLQKKLLIFWALTMRNSCPFFFMVALWDYERIKFSTVMKKKRKKRTRAGKHQVISQPSTASRVKDLEKSTWFSRAVQGRVTAVLSQVKENCAAVSWPQEHSFASLSLLSIHPSFRTCYNLTTWHQGAHCTSICSYSQAEETLRDRWMDEGVGKIAEGKVNSQVSIETSWVSFVSFRLAESQSTTA